MSMNPSPQENLYLLLDSRSVPLAHGMLLSPPDLPTWQIRILDDKLDEVMLHEQIRLVPMGDSPSLLGKILRGRNDYIVVEKLQQLDSEMRQNLRMPTRFRSFLYPITGSWRGRREMEANDLSCGGIAFFCQDQLDDGEEVEAVVPITSEPMILRSRILRRRPSSREDAILYAAKFVDLCGDEEMLIREAVFNVQLRSRPKG